MAHPQHNFTSNFNGSDGHNAELTLDINGVEKKYTPAGNDQTYNVPGVARIDINLDGADLVQAIQTALDGAAQPLLVEMSVYDEEVAYQYIGDMDGNWYFGTCTTNKIVTVTVAKEDGALNVEQIPVANGVVIVPSDGLNVYSQLRTAIALGQLPVLSYVGANPVYAQYEKTADNGDLIFVGALATASDTYVQYNIYTVSDNNTVTVTTRAASAGGDGTPDDENGFFNTSLYTTPGDGVTESLTLDDFRIKSGTSIHGNNIEFVPTHQEGGIDFGEVWLNPGTYILNIRYTLQWVGNPRGTFAPLVCRVGGQPFDFSFEQENTVITSQIRVVTARQKVSVAFPFDADTPPMGIWVETLSIAQLASNTHPAVVHDTTLAGSGTAGSPLRVTTDMFGKVKDIPTSISQFRTGDVIPVDGPNGPAKMDKADLIQNVLSDIISYVDYDLSDAITGYYYDASGNLITNVDSCYKNISFNASDAGKFVTISTNRAGTLSDTRYYVLLNSSGNRIDSKAAGQIKNEYNDSYTFPVPVNEGWVLKASWNNVVTPTIKRNDKLNSVIAFPLNSLNDRTDVLDTQINGKTIYNDIDLSGATLGYYYNNAGNLVADSSSAYENISFTSSDADKFVTISTNRVGTISDSRYYLLYDSDNRLVDRIMAQQVKNDNDDLYTFPVPVENGWVLKASWNKAVTPTISFVESYVPSLEEKIVSAGYVSVSGNDTTGNGSIYSPFKTLSKAIESGFTEIVVDGGVYTDNQIDLSKTIAGKITIKGVGSKKVIFKRASSLLVNSGAEELVSGYTKVYSVDSINPGYSGNAQWLFFDGLNDEDTAISATSAHPLERGLFYRNDCTKIVKCTAVTLADALVEIESSDSFKWFYDSGKLYFSRSNSDTSIYPIYKAGGSYLVCKDNLSLNISNIEFRYGRVNLEKLNVVNMYDVACKYVYAYGAFAYTNCLAVTFDHCEGASCFMDVNGDGFNGNASTTEIGSRCSQVTLRECWAHDNNDDGYSDHGGTEATIDGGLFEYNQKGGITPSYGCHCVCKNSYSRHNKNGFYYTGTATDSGNAGQMACYDCVSENNNELSSSSNGGFKVNGTGNRAILVNCKSLNDHIAFRIEAGYAKLIDCGYVGADLAVVSGGGTVDKIKTTLVE